ncbi:hypothetical protein [Salinarchaeum laminariae]|uniref:hypothetical protein n=1 Tax=Salinarchaeum laminariae TaxID=869888 RepID=UPI0020BE1C32|nr:hypothetical protein [Salinarchaeum laminariae]
MHRRRFLTTATSVSIATLAGCSGLLGGDGGGRSDPEKRVVNFYAAIDDGDADAARSMIHPDGPLAENPSVSGFGGATISIESTSLLEESDGEATVEYDLVVNDEELTNEHVLRKRDGEWLIWE